MQTLTAKTAKKHFDELLLDAQISPIVINENSNDGVIIMSIKDYESLEVMKQEYLQNCFIAAEKDLDKNKLVDGAMFLSSL